MTTLPNIDLCPVIVTKCLVPTNTRGTRVKATSGSGRSIVIAWDHELGEGENHAAAAAALAAKLWTYTPDMYTLRGGVAATDGGQGFAWTVSRTV